MADPNHIRFQLFGLEAADPLPVAALTRAADLASKPDTGRYWLRADPVTMWADMARVYMSQCGFADLDPYERNEIEACVRGVLAEAGIELQDGHPERWCIALTEAPGFDFVPLPRALGKDLGETLPQHPEAQFWRRLLGEIQVALHHCPVNARRREQGRLEINSLWFWGGGFLPPQGGESHIDAVYSDDPVSSGLAIINDCPLQALRRVGKVDFSGDGRSVLIDWTPSSGDAHAELNALEGFLAALLPVLHRGGRELTLIDGSGAVREYARARRFCFWRRRRPLAQCLPTPLTLSK